MIVHNLASGASVISLHPQGFKFSDGTECPPQDQKIVDFFKMDHAVKYESAIKGMTVVSRRPIITHKQLEELASLVTKVDLVICPTDLIQALYNQGWRDQYPRCVTIGPTKETRGRKELPLIVDINGWRY